MLTTIRLTRHAFLVLCHKQPRQLNALTGLFARHADRADVFMHVDVKFAHIQRDLVQRPNAFAFSRYRMQWGGFGIVQATLDLMRRALNRHSYEYIHLLSGQCLPLQPVPLLMEHFDTSGMEYMHSTPFPVRGLPYRGFDRILVEYPPHLRGRYRGIKAKQLEDYKEMVLKDPSRHRRIDHLPPLHHGSQWFSITGDCARWMLRYVDAHPEYADYFEASLIPDEMFFQTLLMASPYAVRREGNPLRYMDWKRGGPYTFTREDLPALASSTMMFARKFDIGKDEALVAQLMHILTLRAIKPSLPVSALIRAAQPIQHLDAKSTGADHVPTC